MAAKDKGSDSHRGVKLPTISETDFPTWDMLFNASLMRHPGVQEAFEIEVSEDETPEDKEIRINTYGKGNRKAYSFLSEACMDNKTAILIMRKVISRDKEIWANSIMKELKSRFSKHAADVLQKLISEFNSLTMTVGDTTETFLDRVFEKVNCISEIDETETPTEAQIMSRVKEGIKFAHPNFFDLLELVELDYKVFISKVEKYNKPSLLVVEKVFVEKKWFQVRIIHLIIGTRRRNLIATGGLSGETVLLVARANICCAIVNSEMNIMTDKEISNMKRLLTRNLQNVQIVVLS